MANHYQNGGRNVAIPDENRPSWRPQDQSQSLRNRGNEDDHDYRSWRERNYRDDSMERDPRRWEGSRGSELGHHEDHDLGSRSTERYGQGQSGYGAGRYGDDRSQQIQNRNEMHWSGHYEERGRDLGTDDRWSRGSGSWAERGQRGYEPERYGAQGGYGGSRGFDRDRGNDRGGNDRGSYDRGSYDRGSYDRGADRGYDQRMAGYDSRSERVGYGNYDQRGYDQRMGYSDNDQRRNQSNERGYDPRGFHDGGVAGSREVGYGGGMGRGQDLSEGFQRGTQDQRQQHTHRGTGPHRGKGPMGYQRSDERIREMVCDALADDDEIDASQIHVTVKDGEVTLTGVVDSRRIKREAEDCVSAVSGVRDVQIQLRIKDEKSQSSGSQSVGSQSSGSQGVGSQSAQSTQSAQSAQSTGSNQIANGASGSKHETESSSDKKHRA